MALPESGPITLQMIADEFGGTPPLKLTDYYGAAAGIPTSGPITLKDFYGASAITPTPTLKGVIETNIYDLRGEWDTPERADSVMNLASIASDGDLVILAVAVGEAWAVGTGDYIKGGQPWQQIMKVTGDPESSMVISWCNWDSTKGNPYFSPTNTSANRGRCAAGIGAVYTPGSVVGDTIARNSNNASWYAWPPTVENLTEPAGKFVYIGAQFRGGYKTGVRAEKYPDEYGFSITGFANPDSSGVRTVCIAMAEYDRQPQSLDDFGGQPWFEWDPVNKDDGACWGNRAIRFQIVSS